MILRRDLGPTGSSIRQPTPASRQPFTSRQASPLRSGRGATNREDFRHEPHPLPSAYESGARALV